MLSKFHFCPSCGSSSFLKNDARSKRCAHCGFTYYINASGAYVAIITNEEGKILVARRKHQPAKGTLDLPGGFADPGETAEEGVAREVFEETGLRVCSMEYLFSLPNRYEYSGMIIPTLDMFFRVTVADTTLAEAHDDVEALQWLSPADIHPELFGLDSIRLGIAKYLSRG